MLRHSTAGAALIAALALAPALAVAAEEPAATASASPSPGEPRLLPRARLDLGWALSFRQDQQSLSGVDLSAKGVSPVHLGLDGAVWFGTLPLGLAARFDWDRIAISGRDFAGTDVKITAIGLSAGGGLAGRLDLKGWALEGDLGWRWLRMPIVRYDSVPLSAGSVDEHGPMVALRFGRPTGHWFMPDVHASTIPYSFARSPTGSSHGWALDAGVGLGFGLPIGSIEGAAVVGYDFGISRVDSGSTRYDQLAHRVSVALRITVPGPLRPAPPVPTGPGRLRGRLLFEDGKPAAGQVVDVSGVGSVKADATGAFVIEQAGPGAVTVRASAPGMRPAVKVVEVPPEAEASVELQLVKPTGPGSIVGVVYDRPVGGGAARKAVAGAEVKMGDQVFAADEKGAFVIEQAGPGLVPLAVSARGYLAQTEVVSVLAEAEARVEISIVAETARQPATVLGTVRSLSGKPVKAKLTVSQAHATATTGANGEFRINLPGGRYQIRVEAQGYLTQVKTVEVADGDQAIFNINLHPAK